MLLLQNAIQPYAWGSPDGMAELVGSEPTGGREAELWVGAHPTAPSMVVGDPDGRSLADVIAGDPVRWLGEDLVKAGFTTLPFLLKVLAIGEPLSLQAHPSAEQARTGYDREELAGTPLDAPDRTYRDPGAKPESLVSLAETWALCGFRPVDEAAVLVEKLGVEGLAPLLQRLRGPESTRMAEAFVWLLHVDPGRGRALAQAVGEAATAMVPDRSGDPADEGDPFRWVARLAELHPHDPTIVAPLLLNVVRLAPGDAVHLPAGNLHAYLSGAGIEVMAASDNVLRGGLTPKHIDVEELLAIVRFDAGVPVPPARRHPAPGMTVFDSGEDSFGLAVIEARTEPVVIDPVRPSLLLAVGGAVDVAGLDEGVSISGGAAVFVAPGEGPLEISGRGQLWWATVGDGLPG